MHDVMLNNGHQRRCEAGANRTTSSFRCSALADSGPQQVIYIFQWPIARRTGWS